MSLAGLSTLSTWSTLPGYQANLPEPFRASVWDKVLPPVRLLSEVLTYIRWHRASEWLHEVGSWCVHPTDTYKPTGSRLKGMPEVLGPLWRYLTCAPPTSLNTVRCLEGVNEL